MKFIAYFLLNSFCLLSPQSMAGPQEKDVFQGISKGLVCHLDQQRNIARVELAQYLDAQTRLIVFYDQTGGAFRSEVANCEYEDSHYICRWGSNHVLKIKMSRVEVSVANRMVPGEVLRGWMDSDVFRPGTGISCPLQRSPKT
jgi:hypothetical protein